MKRSDNIRCIREYQKKDGSITYHAEVRRKREKPLRKACKTLTEAKNWVRSTESAILEGKLPQETKARKYTVNDLIEQYETIYLSRYPKRIRSQVNSLEQLRRHFNVEPEGAHRAMSDVIVNMHVFKHLCRKFRTVNDVFNVLSKPILMKHMPFRPHKGRLFKEIPIEYLIWASKRDFDEDLIFSLRTEISRRKKGNLFSQASNPFSQL